MPNPSGRRADGHHWQEDKDYCAHGHDIRVWVDDRRNPNVYFHHRSGCRQCATCRLERSRLIGRVKTARRAYSSHQRTCQRCLNGYRCDIALVLHGLFARRARERGYLYPRRVRVMGRAA